MRWAVSRLAQRLRAETGRTGLTRLETSVLANLRHGGPLTPTALADVEGLQPQSLTRTINALDEAGLVERSRDDRDRRQQTIRLTAQGRAALDDHVRDGNAWLAEALRTELTPAERDVLRIAADLMTRLAGEGKPGSSLPGAAAPQ
ncbi:MarR family transcriptional regulator [Amycolatopsis sp. KNN50.9b]|nr:MarR family transcriptional regulator [Amycolatopsis sp. KNN50.9b]